MNGFVEFLQGQREVLLIILGAAIAVLSPALVDKIQRRRQATRFMAVQLAELHEIRYRLALVAGQMRADCGTSDRAFLQWELRAIKSYAGPNRSDDSEQLLSKLLAFSDGELAAAMAFTRQQADSASKQMKHYTVPYLESHLHVLSDVPKDLQVALLDFKYYLDLYNAGVDISNKYFDLTFTISGVNHGIAKQNLLDSYRNLGQMAIRLVNKADRAIKLIDPKWALPEPTQGA